MTALDLLKKMTSLRVLIVGDLCLDSWCYYDPSLAVPSAETGIPRLAIVRSEFTPGAAGTVANNLASLGAQVSILSLIGDDGHGLELLRALAGRNIAADLLLREPALPTFTYTKLINAQTGIEDQPRADFIFTGELPVAPEQTLCERLRAVASEFDLICVSDQVETERGGVVTAAVRDELASLARDGALVWVDSRRRIEQFRHAVLKVNEEESRGALARVHGNNPGDVRKHAGAKAIIITRGGSGVDIFDENGQRHVGTKRVPNPVDICGAGDSFTAGAACAWAAGASLDDAALLGHLVASVTIMKRGTGVASPEELLAAERTLVSR
jgi:rfaE bifunctional protein kinase chain/domain